MLFRSASLCVFLRVFFKKYSLLCLFRDLFIYLAVLSLSCDMKDLSCSMRDLWFGHVGSSSVTRGQTQAPGVGRVLTTGPPGKSLCLLKMVTVSALSL